MKQFLLCTILIGALAMFIHSCSSSSDNTSSTASTASTACTSTTASGSISGIDNLSGTYNMSWIGSTGECIDNSSGNGGAITRYLALSALPGEALSFKHQKIVTSSTSFIDKWQFYSDTNCSTSTGYYYHGYANVSVGDNVTGLTAGSNPARPTSASKVTYDYSCSVGKGETDNTSTFLGTLFSGVTFTTGEEKSMIGTGTYKNIWATDNSWFYEGSKSTSSYPSDWSSIDDISSK